MPRYYCEDDLKDLIEGDLNLKKEDYPKIERLMDQIYDKQPGGKITVEEITKPRGWESNARCLKSILQIYHKPHKETRPPRAPVHRRTQSGG